MENPPCWWYLSGKWRFSWAMLVSGRVHVFGKSTIKGSYGILHDEQIFLCRERFLLIPFFSQNANKKANKLSQNLGCSMIFGPFKKTPQTWREMDSD